MEIKNTCAKWQGLSLKNGVDILDFCAEKCVIYVAALCLPSFSMGSTLGVKRDLILAPIRKQIANICVIILTGIPYRTCRKTRGKKKCFPTETSDHY